jgi:exopolysaccharide production protein ExoZ
MAATSAAWDLTTAFGFVEPALYISKGAWSIGNEMVYYALTPIIVCTFNRSTALGNILTGVTILIGILFSSYILRADAALGAQWHTYINPFNNLFLYCAGIALFYNARDWQLSRIVSLAFFAVPLLMLVLYPAQGDQIHIVTGVARVVFCSASVALVLAFYKSAFTIPRALSAALTHLGVITYGVYLLHPIAYEIVLLASKNLRIEPEPSTVFTLTIITTIIAAQASFTLIEEPIIRVGKRFTSIRSNASG